MDECPQPARETAHRLDARAPHRRPTFVTASLGYLDGSTPRPVSHMYDPPDGTPKDNCRFDFRAMQVVDARGLAGTTSVHREGFELWYAPSSVADFHDAPAVVGTYHAECAALACAATGGSSAIVFDHQVRQREAGRPPLTFGRGGGSRPGGVGRVHNDYSEASGRRRLGLVLRDAALASRVRRFCIVNVWRSIRGAIVDTPLAVCDARSVSRRELVAGEIRYADRQGEIYLFRHSPAHRWYYYPGMDRDEALVFKQFDSQVGGVARFTPHAAFDLPDIPADAPLRESIEARCLVLFD